MLSEIVHMLTWVFLQHLLSKMMGGKGFEEWLGKMSKRSRPSRALAKILGSGASRMAIPLVGATIGTGILSSLWGGGREQQTPEQAMLNAAALQAGARQQGNSMQDLLETLMMLRQLQGQKHQAMPYNPYLLPPMLGTTGQAIDANMPYRV